MIECKTIFIFRHYTTPPYIPGSSRHFRLSKCMRNKGHEVYLFLSNYSHGQYKYIKKVIGYYEVEDIDGINFVFINNKPSYKGNDWRRLLGMLDYSIKCFRAAKELSKHSKKPDIIIGSVAHIFAVFAAYLASRRLGARFIMEIAELWPEQYIAGGVLTWRNPLAWILSLLSRFMYTQAEKIIVVKDNTRKKLLQMGVPLSKVIVLPQGLMKEDFFNSKSTNKGKFTVVYAGALNPLYPVEELLNTARILKKQGIPVMIKIYGYGIKKNYIKETIYRESLNNIVVNDPIPKNRINKIYAQADVLIVIEHKVEYGFSEKLIDYIGAMKPILLASESEYNLPHQLFKRVRPKAEYIAKAIKEYTEKSQEDMQKIANGIYEFAMKNMNMQKNYELILEPLIQEKSNINNV